MKLRLGSGAKQDGNRFKKAQAEHLPMGWIDESGFMPQPLVRRTWAPRGQAPIQPIQISFKNLDCAGRVRSG